MKQANLIAKLKQSASMLGADRVVHIILKAAITQDISEIGLALSVLNDIRNVNMARLALLYEAERQEMEKDR